MSPAAIELTTHSRFRLTHEVGPENQTFIITPPEEGAMSFLAPFQSLMSRVGYGCCESLFVEHEGKEVADPTVVPFHLLDLGDEEMDFSRTMQALTTHAQALLKAWIFQPQGEDATVVSETSLTSGQHIFSLDGLFYPYSSLEDALARINREASSGLRSGTFSDRRSNVGGILRYPVPGAERIIVSEIRKSAPSGQGDPFYKYDSQGLHSMRDLEHFLAGMGNRIRRLKMEHATLWGMEESVTVTVDPSGNWRIELTTSKTSAQLLANIQQTLQKV